MLILVVGLPGSGKSTVARLLAEYTGAIVLNSDVLRRELFPDSRSYTSTETQAVIREMERRVRELLDQRRRVILDALFTKQRPRDSYRELAGSLGVPFCIVHVTAPEDTVRERLELRARVGDVSEATFVYYLDRKPHFEEPRGDHYTIENSGDTKQLESDVIQLAEQLELHC